MAMIKMLAWRDLFLGYTAQEEWLAEVVTSGIHVTVHGIFFLETELFSYS